MGNFNLKRYTLLLSVTNYNLPATSNRADLSQQLKEEVK